MTDVITTRAMAAEDLDSTLDLLRVSLGETAVLKRTAELFSWKHFDNPFGRSIALVAESGDRIIGLRAFMRWQLMTPSGDVVHCVRAVDTATHPDFQRRGIFRRLTEEAIEEARATGVDLVFNTPNPRSGAGYLSMGWSEVGKIGVLVRPGRRKVTEPDPLSRPEAFLEDPLPPTPLDIEDRPARGLRTPRRANYLKWRFASHPGARYFRVESPEAVAVVRPNVRRERPELLVVDVYGRQLPGVFREVARRSHAAYVATWFSPGVPERKAAIRSGLMPVPGVAPMTLMARPLSELDMNVFDLASWDLAVSDLELL
jgi:GNAT superfamily N-acetyltransferase